MENKQLLAALTSHIKSRLSIEPDAIWNSCMGDHFTLRTDDVWLLNSCVFDPLRRSTKNTWFAVLATIKYVQNIDDYFIHDTSNITCGTCRQPSCGLLHLETCDDDRFFLQQKQHLQVSTDWHPTFSEFYPFHYWETFLYLKDTTGHIQHCICGSGDCFACQSCTHFYRYTVRYQ